MKRTLSLLLGIALTASSLSAMAATYELRRPMKDLRVIGSTSTGSGSTSTGNAGTTTPAPAPAPATTLKIQASNVDFGQIGLGVSRTGDIVVSNTGTAGVTLGQLNIDNDPSRGALSETDNCSGKKLAAGGSCTVSVQAYSDWTASAGRAYSLPYVGDEGTTGTLHASTQGQFVYLQLSLTVLDGTNRTYLPGYSTDIVHLGDNVPLGQTRTVSFKVVNKSNLSGKVAVEMNSYSMESSSECDRVLAPAEACTFTITYTSTYPHYAEQGRLFVGYTENKVALDIAASAQ